MTQKELGKHVKMTGSAISNYENERRKPTRDELRTFAKVFNVDMAYLLGMQDQRIQKDNVRFRVRQIPVISPIITEKPALAQNNVKDYFNLDTAVYGDFALEISDNSMAEAGIKKGGILFAQTQAEVKSGDIAVLLVEEQVLVRKIFFQGKQCILQDAGKDSVPKIYPANHVEVLGVPSAVLNKND